MSDTAPSAAAVPPGWYADATVPGQMRWWSGTEWTEHVAAPYSGAPLARPVLPADRPVYSVFIWLIVLLPLLTYGSLFAWQPNFDYLSNPSDPTSIYGSIYGSILTPGYFVIIFGSWIVYGLTAVFAWRDVVWLRAQGVVRPFPWPWVFLSSLAYVIGRSVIVHRVAAPRGRTPIWVLIAVIAVGFIVSTVWTFSFMAGMLAHFPNYSGQYTG
ncbi:MAG: DUF2510 domain-containing protein [Pseudolysinimonas sp.]